MSQEKQGKTTAIIAHVTIVGSLIAITMNMEPKNPFARFHVRQAFGIHLLYHALAIVLSFSGIVQASFSLFIVYILLIVWGISMVIKEKTIPIPGLGTFFQKWFTFIP